MCICKNCSVKISGKQKIYCSKKCQQEFRGKIYIEKWLKNEISGYIKLNYRLSSWVRNYLLKEANYKCILCNWGEINPISEKVPLHVDHIDGNAANCKRENLRVICPNCHSLTPNFGALNIGKSVRKY